MYLIGLTGGIASGKSTVAKRFAEHGAAVIDADQLARAAVAPGTDALAHIADIFGPEVIAEDGSLNRARLGSIVFGNPTALSVLNNVVHPAVRALSSAAIAAAERADPEAVVVYDVPLLVEASVGHPFDLIVVVHAEAETRVRRMVELRGMPEDDARRRISAQAGDADRLAVADVVIDSMGSLDETLAQVDRLWDSKLRANHRPAHSDSSVGGAP
ncbi:MULTISPECIES: dephospho-CoA kinase [Cryobacterium]|uniref:dephospho-CoA kinase n=1 Tax=Cryobacterium TaxID=69578 RepID=UPI000B4DD7AF|nr:MULTISPECIES: dephospho-CoA kinase [Cryobacterium]ASD22195.1 dephospho-CoA kinase [Cryobacterium sp. LW097]POH65491.1 dephospho-CoA kinase [Cryobacterium zongtaii]TFC45189.1 dephospho-CoA kinase [Cryobacterium sp. TMN-39-2]TFC55648.1 dephospho-CoA kinase [Cryobacterium sp. TMB3-1-2]TFC57167.1 dephospho-CoA kinase [Cryobacterium sp. TMB1-7]